LLAQA